MRNFNEELHNRVEWIKETVRNSGCDGVVFGNSGGKDSALAGILCKRAFPDKTIGIIMPCESKQNYGQDTIDALLLAKQFGIETRTVDLTYAKRALLSGLKDAVNNVDLEIVKKSFSNINPRLRMTTLYAVAQTENCLVAGTGNKSENVLGYFTKWGDGAFDFNPVGDLTVKEVYAFLEFLKAPESILTKKPSAGLWEGQTDEADIGLSYKEVDEYILEKRASDEVRKRIDTLFLRNEHKRHMPPIYNQ